MRTSTALIAGIAVGATVAVAAVLVISASIEKGDVDRATSNAATDEAARRSGAVASNLREGHRSDGNASSPSMPSTLAAPVTPDYGPRSDSARPIYRCRVRGATVYSHEPCTDGRLVDESSAVGGFDSRPSDRLARLVADGRAAAAATAVVPSTSNAGGHVESVDCATLRRQIRDLDDAARLRYESLRTLDELRAVRQDVATSIARHHC